MELQLEHIALSVSNLERSMAFYRDLLGLEPDCIIECSSDQKLGCVVGLAGCSARIAKLKSGNVILELFEYLNPRGRRIPPDRTQADNGLTHLGFRSNDIQADYRKLKGQEVRFYGEPIEYRPGVWNVYFYGPDGETCELRQTAD
jgi:glyoxylase I family protein